MTNRHIVMAFLGALVATEAFACGGYDGPTSFIAFGGRNVLDMPDASFYGEVREILNSAVIDAPSSLEEGEPYLGSGARQAAWENTIHVDLGQLRQAVGSNPKAEAIAADYRTMRTAMFDYVTRIREAQRAAYYRHYGGRATAPDKEEETVPFDLAPYEPTLARIPVEFARYIRGAAAYHNADYENAIKHFESGLNLPAKQRKYRSTWAAFMLGKAWAEREPARAAQHFEKTRALAQDGFADPLHFAADSIGWQAQAEAMAGDYVHSIYHYAQIYKYRPNSIRPDDDSLAWACGMVFAPSEVASSVVQDALSREIVAAWLVAHHGDEKCVRMWLAALDRLEMKDVVSGADRLAWTAYNGGNMELAARCIEHSDPNAPYARWVKAKLVLRDGKIEEGNALLGDISASLTGPGIQHQWMESYVTGEIGALRLTEGDYKGSLDAFRKYEEWSSDSLYIAEWVLTIDELEAYVKTHAQAPTNNRTPQSCGEQAPTMDGLRLLLAQRLAGLGQWERAAAYYPGQVDSFRVEETVDQIVQDLRKGGDEGLSPRKRAESLLEAAQLVRKYGDLLLPDSLPDEALQHGYYDPKNPYVQRGFPPSSDELARLLANTGAAFAQVQQVRLPQKPGNGPVRGAHLPEPQLYLYHAAELMRRCADLLPNNDVMAAKALYLGGSYLKARDPQSADYFYKALVRRNPNLLIAQQADKLRWFPREFTDKISYRPLPSRWIQHRTGVIFLTVTAATTTLIGAVLVLWLRRRCLSAAGKR